MMGTQEPTTILLAQKTYRLQSTCVRDDTETLLAPQCRDIDDAVTPLFSTILFSSSVC